jgi:dTDP-4-dehydrorhamnose 3,5-epimerase
MKLKKTTLDGSYEINPDEKADNRGFFTRYWCKKEYSSLGLDANIVQINSSMSKNKGTIRGLHFQYPPKAETKIIRCIRGSIFDVIVDIRQGSKTYGQWFGKELNEKNRAMMYVPQGFAHGFQTLIKNVELLYLHSEYYSKEHEGGLLYNDINVGIDWPLAMTEISPRDKSHPTLNELEPFKI